MRGYYVERRWGWDCHGLPLENEVEKQLGISGPAQIEEYGIAKFNEACRSIVLRFTSEWRDTIRRVGRWVDFDHEYRTMDADYMETIWWVFKQLWDQDLIYEGHAVQPYCPRCSTPLSNFEVNQGYQEVQDPSITVRLPVKGEGSGRTYFLVWTTTPWTLPSNLGLAVGEDIDYVLVEDGHERYWLAREQLATYWKGDDQPEILSVHKGRDLVGMRYAPPFDYFRELAPERTFKVVAADFVTTEEGTGIVHMAPAFGEDDYQVGQAEGWPLAMPIDAECRFTGEVPEHAGVFVKDADQELVRRLRDQGLLVHHGTMQHSYPFCYRCDSPLIYRAISAWFLDVEPLKEAMIRVNKEINWVPEYLRDGRFGNWLEGAREWNLSRNRYWGTPLPIWISEDGKEQVCVGSRAELAERSGTLATDLHKHFVDEITIPAADGQGVLRRVPQVLDCWFESGSMPYAQNHYPFVDPEEVAKHLQADFIAEGLDQTRGWFYTLVVLGTALFDRPPFKNVIVNGLILAEDGKKMSKRLKNYPEPEVVLDEYGADALRAYLINSAAVRAGDLKLSETGIRDVMRKVLIPLWNAHAFLVTYANLDGWTPARPRVELENRLDRWILSNLQSLIASVNTQMDHYRLYRVVPALDDFIDDLTNWYIRLSRPRFWKQDDDADKNAAYQTLYEVLVTFSKVLAPVLPFTCEAIYRNLTVTAKHDGPDSVHLCDYPQADEARRDRVLEREMTMVRSIVGLGRALRARHKIRTRQPLSEVTVVARSEEDRALILDMEGLILDELNVKRLVFTEREEDLVHMSAKANFRTLGKRFGKEMQRAATVIRGFDLDTIRRLEGGATVEVCGQEVGIDDILIERKEREGQVTETGDGMTVSLCLELTPELKSEGVARELKNKIQNMRKEADFDVADRIAIELEAGAEIAEQVGPHEDYVRAETLAEELSWQGKSGQALDIEREWSIDESRVWIGLRRLHTS
jgi:isoleucyl-tRNA synthetase